MTPGTVEGMLMGEKVPKKIGKPNGGYSHARKNFKIERVAKNRNSNGIEMERRKNVEMEHDMFRDGHGFSCL